MPMQKYKLWLLLTALLTACQVLYAQNTRAVAIVDCFVDCLLGPVCPETQAVAFVYCFVDCLSSPVYPENPDVVVAVAVVVAVVDCFVDCLSSPVCPET